MTRNQLEYHANRETERANIARERENYRSNLAKETELNRSNLAKEYQARKELDETIRANKTREGIQRAEVPAKYLSAFGTLARGAGSLATTL